MGVPTGRSTTWDEHPNGRFGDVRSPAYGELDGWGVSLKLTPAEALAAWGRPNSISDISKLFAKYLNDQLRTLPWSDMPLMAETESIVPFLLRMTQEKDWWTVGSQPAVDGIRSDDPALGFGPKGGYIYQKAFVEYWASAKDVETLEKKIQNQEGRDVTFYAASTKGDKEGGWKTNMEKGEANAVTWGCFPGKEIVTTTLIEEISFKAWKVCLDLQLNRPILLTSFRRRKPLKFGESGKGFTRRALAAESSSKTLHKTGGLLVWCTTTTSDLTPCGSSFSAEQLQLILFACWDHPIHVHNSYTNCTVSSTSVLSSKCKL